VKSAASTVKLFSSTVHPQKLTGMAAAATISNDSGRDSHRFNISKISWARTKE